MQWALRVCILETLLVNLANDWSILKSTSISTGNVMTNGAQGLSEIAEDGATLIDAAQKFTWDE